MKLNPDHEISFGLGKAQFRATGRYLNSTQPETHFDLCFGRTGRYVDSTLPENNLGLGFVYSPLLTHKPHTKTIFFITIC